MKSHPSSYKKIGLAAALCGALWGQSVIAGEIVGAPIDLSAFVHEALIPGATIFEDTHTVTGASTTPTQSAEYFYSASKGENLSGRSTNITGAFASSLAESNGNGGVGVTAFIGGSPSNSNPAAIGQLVSEATWAQTFTYNGTIPAAISLQLHIPALQVGLIGVAPNRDSVSATETAEAEATLETTIIHPDSSTSRGASFEFGLSAFEQQLIIRPGDFANFADVRFLGANASTVSLFDSFKDNGDRSNPRFSIDAVTTNVKLGTLQPGDTVSYVYKLLAEGTTHGGEHGYVAFLGDPFGLDLVSDNLVLSIDATETPGAVPEPASWALALLGLAFVGARGRRSSAPKP
jgi:MYXO-CTERM domain-containing protein